MTKMWHASIFLYVLASASYVNSAGILYPRESESREVKSLDGMWNFRLSLPDPLVGFKERWYMKDLSKVRLVYKINQHKYYKYWAVKTVL